MTHTQFVFFFIVMGGAAALLGLAAFMGFRGRWTREGEPTLTREQMKPYTIWGVFYINPDDPRGWVPKPHGYGYTVNLRSRGWAWVIVGLFLITIVAAILLVILARH